MKKYASEKMSDPEGGFRHVKISLDPLNPAYEPIVLTPEDEDEVRVLAEFVEVVG